MDYPIEHPAFEGRSILVRTSGFLASVPQLIVDDVEIPLVKGRASLEDNHGQSRELKLKLGIIGRIPKVVIDQRDIDLGHPLNLWEEMLTGPSSVVGAVFCAGSFPLAGGLMGVLVSAMMGSFLGGLTASSGVRIFRSNRDLGAKCLISGVLCLGAVGVYVASGTAIQTLIVWNTDATSKEFLGAIARDFNKTLPFKVDDQTEVVRAEGLEGVLVYHLRLVKILPGQVSEETLIQTFRPTVVTSVCSQLQLRKQLLNKGVVLRYVVSDSQSGLIGEFDLSVNDCNSRS